ncbi:putative calcium-binding ef-hand protein [Golovinomyces cichoracearum]|uniref:Putative calcium-binding ef-hand protein n=1 Tax=Golovinomyces cichoracearum TaxID=62708 RepID=A0A420IFL0_9PEZI|nr:putative calcium-binding ef-hand protein [Golovinomyces cichoracearum]
MTTQGQTSGNVYQASHTSPRISPFRRPEALTSPSPLRQSTPSLSPTKMVTTTTTPSRLSRSSTPVSEEKNTNYQQSSYSSPHPKRENLKSSDRSVSQTQQFGGVLASKSTMNRNTLSKLQPAQVRELREAFQVLDRDSDGLSANSSDISTFFPSPSTQSVTLPVYLNSLADNLSALSPSSELISAFSAFDEDDSGQIDLPEFKDALLNTTPDPGVIPLTAREFDIVTTGFIQRRAFRKNVGGGLGKRGEVFKYHEFVAGVAGGLNSDDRSEKDKD